MFKLSFFKYSILALVVLFSACTKKETAPEPVSALEIKTFSNLSAPQTGGNGQPTGGVFTRFSFSENAVVTNNNWDIAFRGTTILVNGGTQIGITDEPTRTGNAGVSIVSGTLESVTSIPNASTFVQDATAIYAIPTGSNNGWYNYNATTNIISPIAGKVFVVKTYNGKYAKFEILSYYQNAPTTPSASSVSKYYTLRFVYQPNSNTSF